MITQTTKRKNIFQKTVRWSSGFLACMIGVAPAAEARGLFAPGRNVHINRDSSRSRFAFRSVFIPPQYARQAETPLPLSWWEQGSDSPIAIAIGAAEGTRNLDGSKTAAYYWHTDPGNAADNFGSFSFQHLKPQEKESVEKQQTTDDKRWASARRALPEIADQRQMRKLRKFHNQLLTQAKAQNLVLSELELLNGLDLANQSELAALDAWGYIDRLAQARQLYRNPDEQIRQARTWSYWHPTLNRWDAPGLGNTQALILRDQSRRADAVKEVWQQSKARSSRIAQLNPQSTNRKSRRQAPPPPQNDWVLSVTEAQPAAALGFAKQPLPIAQDVSLDDLLAETQIQPSPEQQADIALAEALAIETPEVSPQVQEILSAEVPSAPEWLGAEATLAIAPAESELSAQPSEQPAQAEDALATSPQPSPAVGLKVGLEGSLLMASVLQQPERPTSRDIQNIEGQNTEGQNAEDQNAEDQNAEGQNIAAPSAITSIAAGISEQPLNLSAITPPSSEPTFIASTPKPPRPQDPLSLSTLALSTEPNSSATAASSATSSSDQSSEVATSSGAATSTATPSETLSTATPVSATEASPPPSPSSASELIRVIEPGQTEPELASNAVASSTANPVAPPIAAAPLAASVAPSLVAPAPTPPAPPLSARAQRLIKPAAEATIQGTDQLLQQHLDTAAELRRQAELEAAAKQDAEVQRQAWIRQEQSMVSQAATTEVVAPLNLALAATQTYLDTEDPALNQAPVPGEKSPLAPPQAALESSSPESSSPESSSPESSSPKSSAQASPSEVQSTTESVPPASAAVTAEDVAESIIFFEGISE